MRTNSICVDAIKQVRTLEEWACRSHGELCCDMRWVQVVMEQTLEGITESTQRR